MVSYLSVQFAIMILKLYDSDINIFVQWCIPILEFVMRESHPSPTAMLRYRYSSIAWVLGCGDHTCGFLKNVLVRFPFYTYMRTSCQVNSISHGRAFRPWSPQIVVPGGYNGDPGLRPWEELVGIVISIRTSLRNFWYQFTEFWYQSQEVDLVANHSDSEKKHC